MARIVNAYLNLAEMRAEEQVPMTMVGCIRVILIGCCWKKEMCQMGKTSDKIYYHYCSVDAFYNILQTDTIRFGNPLNMNDSAEVVWLLGIVKEFVSKKGVYTSLLESWNLIENISRTLVQELDCPYIFCLSKEKDVLSQWRSYANAVKNGKNNEVYRKSKILVSQILQDAIMCKNPAFQEEKEYRLYCGYRRSEKSISSIKFRVDDSSIIPFRELCFKDTRHLVIKNIVVGPKSSINNRNLWLFLKSKGYNWIDIDSNEWHMDDTKWKEYVILSQATYR